MRYGISVSRAIDGVSLTELVEVSYLQRLQNSFAAVNGVSSIIRDLEGRPITRPSLLNEACQMVRNAPRGYAACRAHLEKLSATLSSSLLPAYGRCSHLGLLHAGMPIVVEGRHLANWWISQRVRGTLDDCALNRYAARIGIDGDRLVEAYLKMPAGDQGALEVEIERLWNMINEIISRAHRDFAPKDGSARFACRPPAGKRLCVQEKTAGKPDAPPVLCPEFEAKGQEQEGVHAQLGRKTALLDAINMVLQSALGQVSDVELATECLMAACRLTSSKAGMILDKIGDGKWTVLADTEKAFPEAGRAGSMEAPPADQGGFHPALQQALASGAHVIENRLQGFLPWPAGNRRQRASSLLGVCLGDGGEPFGLLVLAGKDRGYSQKDQQDVFSLASAFVQALLRRRAEAALARSERRLTLALTAANEGLWDLDVVAGRIYYSLKCHDLLGYPAGSFGDDPKAWHALVHPDDRHVLSKYPMDGSGSEQIKIDVRMRTAGGSWRWMRIRGKVVEHSSTGRPVRVIGTISDIQDYMETQAALKIANAKLQKLAARDELTGIGNRRRFDQHLVQQWRRCRRDKTPLSLILCDIDHFKAYNDTYGHLQGDRTLQAVAQAIDATLKRPTDLVARFGGEEFAVVLPATDQAGAVALAGEIRTAVEQLAIDHRTSGIAPHVTISLGVATIVPCDGMLPHLLVKAADKALYGAKAGGRNTIRAAGDVKTGQTE